MSMILDQPTWSRPIYRHHNPIEGLVKHVYDVAIVGAGVGGISVAYQLRESGLDIAMIEKETIASGSTGRSGGVVVAGEEIYLRLLLRRGPKVAKNLWQMTYDGIDLLKDMAKDVGSEYVKTQGLIVAESELMFLGMRLEALALRRAGYKAGIMLPYEVRSAIGFQKAKGALVRPNYGSINPVDLVVRTAMKLDGKSADIYENTEVVRIVPHDQFVSLMAPNGELMARNVVVATNVHTPKLGLIEDKLRIIKSHIAATEPTSIRGSERSVVVPRGKSYFYLHQANDGRIFVGGPDEVFGGRLAEENTSEKEQETIGEFVSSNFGFLPKISHGWSGLIAYTRDGIVIAGKDKDNDRLFYNVGGNGADYARLAHGGKLVADLIQGKLISDEEQELASPARFRK